MIGRFGYLHHHYPGPPGSTSKIGGRCLLFLVSPSLPQVETSVSTFSLSDQSLTDRYQVQQLVHEHVLWSVTIVMSYAVEPKNILLHCVRYVYLS